MPDFQSNKTNSPPQYIGGFANVKNLCLIIREGRKELDTKTTEYRKLLGIKSSPAVTNIYGDKIAILIWTDEPEGIIIENSAAAKAYKSYFDIMWSIARQV
ncbi:hypothetical protein HY486_01600 [Candidatus Woesearchaeota archaeon]|nr:hypothetical protein [Candidatus Woesearchaeota archaeon]